MAIAASLGMSGGSMLHSISFALVGVVLMTAALMNRNKAWVYTLSHVVARLCMSVVSRAALLYSMVGLTYPMYN